MPAAAYANLAWNGPASGAMVDTAPSAPASLGVKGTVRLTEQVQISLPAARLKATRLVNAPLHVQGTGLLEKALPKARARALLTVSIGAQPSAIDIAQAVWGMDNGIETGWTPRQIMRVMAAVLAGKVSGAGSNAPVFRDVTDTKPRVSSTTDQAGNRLTVSVDRD